MVLLKGEKSQGWRVGISMEKKKIAFFEEIDSVFYPMVGKYLKDDFTIYYFRIDDKHKKKLRKYLETGKLVDLASMTFEYTLFRYASFYAHENVGHIFNRYFSSSPSIKNVKELLDFPEIEDMYKYRLLLELEKIYEIELKINEVVKKGSFDEIYFFPRDNFRIHSDRSSPLIKNIKVICRNDLKIKLKHFMSRVKNIPFLGAPIYVFFKKVRKISDKKQRQKFKVGIMIYRNPMNIFAMNYLTEIDLVDNNELLKKDVLFIDDRGQINLKDYEKQGYNYASLLVGKEGINPNVFWQKMVKRCIPAMFKSIFFSLFEEPFIIKTNAAILYEYIMWNIFVDNYEIGNYIEKLLPDNLSKICILFQNNVKTWFIYPDNTALDYHLDWDPTKKNETFFSFMYYDNAVVNGNIIERFLKKHGNRIKKYVKTGILSSQIIHGLQEGKLKSPIFAAMKKKNLPSKIIGVFDTAYGNNVPLKTEDGIRFGNDILRLLDEFPDVGIILKTKSEPELTPQLTPIYNKLNNHERCMVFYTFNKEGISAVEVIAASDLVVSAAYTSTTAEALGAKKKAIYYDVAGHDIGNKYYFNRYPNFVAHSYEELKKLINYWLKVHDKEFEDFLNTYVKNEIDPYLDCKAFTRLRKLLMEAK